jgi:hypothetical protein
MLSTWKNELPSDALHEELAALESVFHHFREILLKNGVPSLAKNLFQIY